MNRFILSAMALLFGMATQARGQSLDELGLQIHGYATQGFLYTTQNNILTTESSKGSPAWTEAVVNIGVDPLPKLHVGVQGRYFLLGNYGNEITLDWAAADYKFNDRFGVRFGKVKTPSLMFNEIQDIDPAYLWSLLPQTLYPIGSRNFILSHYGGVVYGTLPLGERWGKMEYRTWGGELVIGKNDGVFLDQREAGVTLPDGESEGTYGSTLRWRTPVDGLLVGASILYDAKSNAKVTIGNLNGVETTQPIRLPRYFAKYEKGKVMVAGEYSRISPEVTAQFTGLPPINIAFDNRNWYAMASYKLTDKFSAGVYHNEQFNRLAPLGPARFSKDWALSARYDFNQFLYAKAEQHFIDGTAQLFDHDLNAGGLKPDTRLTILKLGVSF